MPPKTRASNGGAKKRTRDDDQQDGGSIDVDKLQEMGIRELRDLAKLEGVSTTGTKKDLIERLSNCVKKDNDKDEKKDSTNEDDDDKDNKDGGSIDVDKLQEMGIRELRDLAKLEGVSTTGTKKDLIERLSNCVKKDNDKDEKKDSTNEDDDDKDNKDGGTNGTASEMEKHLAMGIKELRDLAKSKGLAANGSKKDISERLLNASTKGKDKLVEDAKDDEEEDKEEEKKEEKIVKATKKGCAVLDPLIPDHIKNSYHVLQVGDEIYDATLNQTNVGDNNNKFYIIQALESDDARFYMVYNRWGRVGVPGQKKLYGPFDSKHYAITDFEIKFYTKTKNCWIDRKNFKCYQKLYTWLEMDYGEEDKKDKKKGNKKEKGSTSAEPKETILEKRIADFVSLVCNVSMMKQQMMEIGYNAEKLPLGKLSKSTILKGYEVLKRISDVIGQANRSTLEQLSGEFYTVIPHDFGFKKMREFVIDTPQKLKTKLEMVEALGEIEIATKLLEEDEEEDDPFYARYKQLKCELEPIETNSQEFSIIEKYLQNTHGQTHSSYKVDIVQVFKVSRDGEEERFKKFSSTQNRMLLWHGSRLTNWTGILSQGLRIAPPEAPVTGYMFGKGVYFADMFSKSANYCFASSSSRSGVLLLCEVALGEMNELLDSDYNANNLPKGKLSTKGVGQTAPDKSEFETIEGGVTVPFGKPKQYNPKGCLQYNEYIVYNVEQIKMRYLLHVNFNYNW